MLPVPFSFSGRIARWPYFKSCIALGVSCLVPAFVAMTAYDQYRNGHKGAFVGALVLIAICTVVIIWISLTLQARRCRDVGWNPVVLIPIWIIVQLFDPLLAYGVPALAVGKTGTSTVIGAAFNLIWLVTLTFWPSTDEDQQSNSSDPSGRPRTRLETLVASAPASTGASHALRTSPARSSFGRR